jgi:peptidoglycan/xylan/chitin deacetylase (PgdA/CDA1 family)
MSQERDLIGYGGRPLRVVWPEEAKLALSIVVNYEEGSEYAWADGDERNEGLAEMPSPMPPDVRDLSVESVYEYGTRAGIWRLLRLLADYDIKTTINVSAVAVERNPEVGARLHDAGHEPCAHGWRWTDLWNLDREEERVQLRAAIESIERTCGQRPLGWISRYAASAHTRELLVEEGGFLYDSDAFNDDLPYFVAVNGERHLVVPHSFTYNDGKFVIAQGFGSPTDFFDLCRRGVEELRREGHAGHPKMMTIALHPRLTGQAGRVSALREFIEHTLDHGDVWFARRADIARWWLTHHQDFGA